MSLGSSYYVTLQYNLVWLVARLLAFLLSPSGSHAQIVLAGHSTICGLFLSWDVSYILVGYKNQNFITFPSLALKIFPVFNDTLTLRKVQYWQYRWFEAWILIPFQTLYFEKNSLWTSNYFRKLLQLWKEKNLPLSR